MYRYFLIGKNYFGLGANSKKNLFHLGFSALLRNAIKLTLPFIASVIVEYATEGNFQTAMIWAGIFLAASLAYLLAHHYNYIAYKDNSIFVHNTLQQRILEKVARLDENFTRDMSVSFIINSGFADVGKIQTVPDYLFDAVTNVLSIIASIVILISVDTYIGVAALALGVLSTWLFSRNVKKRDAYLAKQQKHQDKIVGLFGQVIDGGKEIRSFDMEDDLNEYLNKYKKDWRVDYFKKRKYNNYAHVIAPALLGLGRIVVYFITAGLILSGQYSVATLVLVVGYYEDIQSQFDKLIVKLAEVSSIAPRIDRVHEILNYQTENMLEFGDNRKDDIKGGIRFIDVSFAYEKQEMLKNINFNIEPHSFTAIVGKSGNGKSTIFRLLLRLYKINKGSILLDDINIYDFSKDVFPGVVSIVTQKPFIFDMSIRENLNLVDSNQENQIAACKRVGVHDYIMSLKDGYNTRLISDAENMSGGEKQLLAFARTLLAKAEILLFDEVTSNLDTNTSKQIFRIMQNLKKDHTVLVITHNPELMKMADDIIVINAGKMVGRGTHNSLMRSNKYYRILQK